MKTLLDKFRVGLVQMSATPDPDKNLQRAIDRLHQAAAKAAQIVCLPELFQTQYFCQREDVALFDLAEPIPGPTTSRLSEVAKQLKIVLVASLFEKRAPGVYHNTAVMIDSDGSLRGIYRKMHIPDDPLYYEKFYFTPGDLGFKAFDTQVGRRSFVGTNGIPRGRDSRRCRGRRYCFIRQRLAGIRTRKTISERRNTTRGRRSSAPMPLPMAFTLRS